MHPGGSTARVIGRVGSRPPPFSLVGHGRLRLGPSWCGFGQLGYNPHGTPYFFRARRGLGSTGGVATRDMQVSRLITEQSAHFIVVGLSCTTRGDTSPESRARAHTDSSLRPYTFASALPVPVLVHHDFLNDTLTRFESPAVDGTTRTAKRPAEGGKGENSDGRRSPVLNCPYQSTALTISSPSLHPRPHTSYILHEHAAAALSGHGQASKQRRNGKTSWTLQG